MKTQYNLTRQTDIGKWWGLGKLLAQHIMTYVQFIQLAMVGGTFYLVVTDKAPSIPIWLLALITVVLVLGMILFEWKFGWPSYFGVWNQQVWEHNNPLKKEIEAIRKELREIKKLQGSK